MEELFESAKEKFMAFSDDQRAERLQQCMEIQLALDECHRVAAVAASTSTSTSNDTTSTSTSLSFHHEKEGTQDSWWKRTSKSNKVSLNTELKRLCGQAPKSVSEGNKKDGGKRWPFKFKEMTGTMSDKDDSSSSGEASDA